MEAHHQECIDAFLRLHREDRNLLAVLLVGSLAHGFAQPDSDVDLALIYDVEAFKERKAQGKTAFSISELCTYPGGYMDCKTMDMDFLELVAKRGSDPARYAFKGCGILYSRIDGLEDMLRRVTRFPLEAKEERRYRFASQILAWRWYYGEGEKKGNRYLSLMAAQKLILFSCRLVLNENEILYPFHKWLLTETKRAVLQPSGLEKALDEIALLAPKKRVEEFCSRMLAFSGLEEKNLDWPNRFLLDSEWNWIDHEAPIDDL